MDRSRIVRYAVLIAVVAIYIATRFWRLTDSCLWFDEIFSVHAATQPWDQILSFVALDLIHPPLFYIILKIWITAGGESVIWLRFLPVIISCFSIVPFLLLCREAKVGFWTATLALFLLAVNGSLIKYAQEVRMYSLLMCLSLFSIWLFARFINEKGGFFSLIIVNVLLIYTHYFGWLVVFTEVAWILMFQRAKLRRLAVMVGVIAASFMPWLIAVSSSAGSGSYLGQNIGWISRPGPREIVVLVFDLIEPFYFQSISMVEPASIYRVSVPILAILFAAGFLYAFSRFRQDLVDGEPVALFLAFAAFPFLLAFVGSWLLPYSIWGTRHLTILAAPISLLLATSFTFSRWPGLKIALVTMLLLFTGYSFGLQTTRSTLNYSWCGFETLAGRIQKDGRGPVYVFEDLAAYHVWFAFRTNPDEKMRGRVIKVDAFPGMAEDKAFFIPRGLKDEFLTRAHLPLNSGRFWVVYRAPGFDLTKPPLDTLAANGFKILQQESYDGDDWKVIAVFVEKIETD